MIRRSTLFPVSFAVLFGWAVLMPAAAGAQLTDEDIRSMSAAQPELAEPVEANNPDLLDILSKLVISLGVVLGLMGLVVWVARRFLPQVAQKGRGGRSIEVLSTRPLGRQRHLMLVRTQGKTMLLGVTPQTIRLVSEFDPDPSDWRDIAMRSGLEPSPGAGNPGTTDVERSP